MGKATDYVIANQSADWCGNPFPFGAVYWRGTLVPPYKGATVEWL